MSTVLQPILNGAATPFQGRFETNTTDGGQAPHFVIEIGGGAGGVVGPNNPLPVALPASTGLDFSANKPTLPNVGTAFAASGPYASYVLIETIPASATRANVDIENISGAQIAVVRDDGTAASAAAPNNASVFALAGGSSAGGQGGSWSSTTFKGRLQIYAASSSAIVTVMVD